MSNTNSAKEVFHGLPVEHCPLCGELIFIEKSEIIQLEKIDCIYCKRSIRAYLPKFKSNCFLLKNAIIVEK